ncbi:MAG: chemotaxis protein CheW [Bacillota bacterium]
MLSNFKNKKNKSIQKNELQFIVFSLMGEKFGVDVKQIKQIIPTTEYTHIPNSPEFIRGVINLRGEIIPIVDLRRRLSLDEDEVDDDAKIIIVELQNNSIGMQVDSVSEMIRIYEDDISAPPKIVKGINSQYLKGVGKVNDKLLILIDLNKILTNQEVEELDKLEI